MQAIILSVGDELVLGQTVDTNSAYLSDQLVRRGIATLYHQTVADEQAALTDAILAASQRAPLVIISGGLGPTEDDLTRQALAEAMAQPLVESAASLEAIAAMYARRGRVMPERNRVQALHPQGAEPIANSCGTAPGIKARLHRATIYVIPGVPVEMVTMFERSILPDLERLLPQRGVILTRKINTFGLGESDLAERLGVELMDRGRNPKVGTTVSEGLVSVRVRSEFADMATAQHELDATTGLIEQRLGPVVFGHDEQSLQEALVALLREQHCTVATAESCTGGLLGKMITDVAGSSEIYLGGWVTYSNQMKETLLGVPRELLLAHGAVSEPVAKAMASSALERSRATLALSITGIAGPSGGTADKPVGTVWIGLASSRQPEPTAQCWIFFGDRPMIRDRAAKMAVQTARLHLLASLPAAQAQPVRAV